MAIYDINGNILSTSGNLSSPIAGKKVLMIGDSNTQYSGNVFKTHLEETYGCSVTMQGYAGATWETEGTQPYCGVNRVNNLIANANANTNLCTDYDYIIIMLGTNCTTIGEITDTSATTTTMCGAIRYCLEKLCYYYRQSKIGVILPFQRAEFNNYQKTKNDLIKTICDEFSIATLDLFTSSQVTAESNTPDGTSYYLGDGLHLGANGQIQVKHTIGKWIAYQL